MTKIDARKKQEERVILDKVFGSYGFDVKDNEPLDFLLANEECTFGVEITKLYYNDGFGRLNNFPNYREKITRGKYVHKDDYVNLKIRASYLLLSTDNQYHFAFNDVTFTKPTEEEFVNLVLQRIKTKNERANQYDKLNVKWLELIISDENGYFDDGSVLSKTNRQKLIDEVKKSKFQTVKK